MAANGKCNCRLNPIKRWVTAQHGRGHSTVITFLYAYVLIVVVSLIVDIAGNLDEIMRLL